MLRKHHLNVINVFTPNTYFLSAKLHRFLLITQHTAAILNVSVTASGGSFTLSDGTQLMICQRTDFPPPLLMKWLICRDIKLSQHQWNILQKVKQLFIVIEVIALQIIVSHLPIWVNWYSFQTPTLFQSLNSFSLSWLFMLMHCMKNSVRARVWDPLLYSMTISQACECYMYVTNKEWKSTLLHICHHNNFSMKESVKYFNLWFIKQDLQDLSEGSWQL